MTLGGGWGLGTDCWGWGCGQQTLLTHLGFRSCTVSPVHWAAAPGLTTSSAEEGGGPERGCHWDPQLVEEAGPGQRPGPQIPA